MSGAELIGADVNPVGTSRLPIEATFEAALAYPYNEQIRRRLSRMCAGAAARAHGAACGHYRSSILVDKARSSSEEPARMEKLMVTQWGAPPTAL